MIESRLASPVFTVAFCCTYALVFALNWPLFLYYPLHGDFVWGWRVLQGQGPAIVWYGFMADAVIAGLVASVCLPSRAVASRLRNYLWLFPCAAMLVCVFLLRHFFI